jgi:Zn-dependent protease with chaperone function
LTETANASFQTKLAALAIDPLLVSMTLDKARKFAAGADRAILDYLLGKMTLPQLKKISKAWNPHREAFSQESGLSDVRKELTALLDGEQQPAPPPEKRQAKLSKARSK